MKSRYAKVAKYASCLKCGRRYRVRLFNKGLHWCNLHNDDIFNNNMKHHYKNKDKTDHRFFIPVVEV